MQTMIFNTVTAAQEIGVSPATVSRWARRLGLGTKLGPTVILSDEDVAQIQKNCHEGPGNPQFGVGFKKDSSRK